MIAKTLDHLGLFVCGVHAGRAFGCASSNHRVCSRDLLVLIARNPKLGQCLSVFIYLNDFHPLDSVKFLDACDGDYGQNTEVNLWSKTSHDK